MERIAFSVFGQKYSFLDNLTQKISDGMFKLKIDT